MNFTEILRKWSDGDTAALEKLTPVVYAELHRIACGDPHPTVVQAAESILAGSSSSCAHPDRVR
jgi:hypothetical protein